MVISTWSWSTVGSNYSLTCCFHSLNIVKIKETKNDYISWDSKCFSCIFRLIIFKNRWFFILIRSWVLRLNRLWNIIFLSISNKWSSIWYIWRYFITYLRTSYKHSKYDNYKLTILYLVDPNVLLLRTSIIVSMLNNLVDYLLFFLPFYLATLIC